MTIKEAVIHVANTLEGINLPVGLIKTVGVPMSNSIDILRQCIEYMEQAEQAEKQKEGEEVAE